MLTKIVIRNFKGFKKVEMPLGHGYVFVGPNNSGKTTALQALALWHFGKAKILRSGKRRYGIAINKRDLVALPVKYAAFLWHNKKIRDGRINISMDITVSGIDGGKEWEYGVKFTYSSEDMIYCKCSKSKSKGEHSGDDFARAVKVSLLPPMSGLVQVEPRVEPGRIDVLVGEGQTAQVLRNICYNLMDRDKKMWKEVKDKIHDLFGIELRDPENDISRGEITMDYYFGKSRKKRDILDLQSMGRGFQQTLLLLAFVYGADASVLLVDEPDAHLEVIRQRQIYKALCESSESAKRQVFIASHSEVLLNEAAQRENIVSFVGSPHKNEKSSSVLKSLRDIGFEYYQLAEDKGWMLYLEGSTDLHILQAFANKMKHKVKQFLEAAPVKYIGNDIPEDARKHFYGLKEAKSDLLGIVLVDNSGNIDKNSRDMVELKWQKREIENYICTHATLIAYAKDMAVKHGGPLYDPEYFVSHMQERIDIMEKAKEDLGQDGLFSMQNKASEDMKTLFPKFAKKVGIPILEKKDFFQLVKHIPKGEISPEISEKLDAIYKIAKSAKSRGGE